MIRIQDSFCATFPDAGKPKVYRAPGRVNLIGEHTDYNLGFVLPIAIDFACYSAAAIATDGHLTVRTDNLRKTARWPIAEIPRLQPAGDWTDYVVGIAQQIQKLGIPLLPQQIVVSSTVPSGAGLSSSAAIEIATALALLDGRTIARKELALLAQRAEREFAGVPCGIMDQYVCVFGEANRALKIDCRSIDHQVAVLPADVCVVAVNSMVKHDLGTSAYADRVRECGEAVAIMQKSELEVRSLRDASIDMVVRYADEMPDTIFRRARHVVTENARVEEFVGAAERSDVAAMGSCFLRSHASMKDDYEITCAEIDFLVESSAEFPGVYGSRMTGGGFGGCTVNLVDPARVDAFKAHIRQQYEEKFSITPHTYVLEPAAGASECLYP